MMKRIVFSLINNRQPELCRQIAFFFFLFKNFFRLKIIVFTQRIISLIYSARLPNQHRK